MVWCFCLHLWLDFGRSENINRCCMSVFIIIPPSPFKIERGQDLILKSNWMDHFSFSQASRQASQSHCFFFFLRKIILRWNVTSLNKKENLMRNSSVSPFCFFVFFRTRLQFFLYDLGRRWQVCDFSTLLWPSRFITWTWFFSLYLIAKMPFCTKLIKHFKNVRCDFFE